MNKSFIQKRITELRMEKGVSEYKMSTDMGRSKNYIQAITSGRALPSMTEFLYMCEYLKITPSDFFNEEVDNPALINEAITALKTLSNDDIALVLNNIKRLQQK